MIVQQKLRHQPNHTKKYAKLYRRDIINLFSSGFLGKLSHTKIFSILHKRIKDLGFSEITIWVLNDNLKAKKFYERNGFKLDDNSKEIEIGAKLLEVRYSKKYIIY